jgi:pimeloyl-ACP methyl ester carboxylesterase
MALLEWLGPWAPARALPQGVSRETWLLRDGELAGRQGRQHGKRPSPARVTRLEAYVFQPTGAVLGTYLVTPGLHFDGPDDPRLERFCRILAHAGFRVVAPTLPTYAELIVGATAVDDLEIVARELVRRLEPGERFTLFSISFGSWPALAVAARMPEHVDAVVTFGGYADFDAAVRFCVDGVMRRPSGDVQLARDPLNQPALFLNLLPWLEVPGGEPVELSEAWREMTYQTWGRMELKAPGRLTPFAEAIASRVPHAQRELFLVGCGVRDGGGRLVEAALARAGDAIGFASPRPALREIACPVVVCHGRDDDVIPWNEAEKLHEALAGRVPSRLLLSGLYGHTGAGRPTPRALATEGKTLLDIARVLAAGGRVREIV